jgi:hypothetical protein
MHTLSPAPVLLQDRFAATLLGLCEEAGAHGLRDRVMAPLLGLLCRRLYGVMAQVTRVMARLQAGRMPMRRKPGVLRARIAVDRQGVGGLRLHYGWAWMIRMAPRMAQYAPQVQMLLDEPEMQAALAASPSLRRALRPLCRGLAFPTPSVMVEARSRRSRSGRAGLARDCPGDVGAAAGTQSEAEGSPPVRSVVAWPVMASPGRAPCDSIARSVPISNHDPRPDDHPRSHHSPRPGGRDSPGVAPAVLRVFTR